MCRLKARENKTVFFIFLWAGFFSLLLSGWVAVREIVINPDAICYLQSAAYMKSGLYAGMHVCDQAIWPFYSILIYVFSKSTSVSLETSAYLIDGFFSLISVWMFLCIIRFLTRDVRILLLAAVVVLLSHEFNAVRQYIVRDHGFWTFYLMSFYALLLYFRDMKLRYALWWNLSLIAATLFRVEGAFFLLFIPWMSFLDHRRGWMSRLVTFISLNMVTIVIALSVIVLMLSHHVIDLTRLSEVKFQLIHGASTLLTQWMNAKNTLANVLMKESMQDADVVFGLVMLAWYVFSVIMNLSVIYFVLLLYAWINRLLQAPRFVHLILWGYIFINIIITASFLIEHFFLSKRYLIALSLMLMLWVPFALNKIIQQWFLKGFFRKWIVIVVVFFIFISSLGGIIDFGYSKKYIRDAGSWLSHEVPKQATLYSNDYQLLYYSHHFEADFFQKAKLYADIQIISHEKWKQYDYVALRVTKKNSNEMAQLLNEIHYTAVQVFSNKRGDEVIIYRRNGL